MAPLRSFFIMNSGFLPINKIINNQRSILKEQGRFLLMEINLTILILQQLAN